MTAACPDTFFVLAQIAREKVKRGQGESRCTSAVSRAQTKQTDSPTNLLTFLLRTKPRGMRQRKRSIYIRSVNFFLKDTLAVTL